MDWAAAERRHDPATIESRVFAGMVRLARARAGLLALRSGTSAELLDVGDDHVLAVRRRHPRSGAMVALANFSDDAVRLDREAALPGLSASARPALADRDVRLGEYDVWLPAWGYAWVADD
jgi:amylosucrase